MLTLLSAGLIHIMSVVAELAAATFESEGFIGQVGLVYGLFAWRLNSAHSEASSSIGGISPVAPHPLVQFVETTVGTLLLTE
jgi:hypothetical protein